MYKVYVVKRTNPGWIGYKHFTVVAENADEARQIAFNETNKTAYAKQKKEAAAEFLNASESTCTEVDLTKKGVIVDGILEY